MTQFNGNAAPDVIHYEAASIVPFARDGYLADLTSKVPADLKSELEKVKADIISGAITVKSPSQPKST